MLTQINSPLMPLYLEETPDQGDKALSIFQTVGILLSLYSHHWQHDEQTMLQWLKRIMPFLQCQQSRLFLTDEEAPYAFASWVEVPLSMHLQLLETATWENLQPNISALLEHSTQSNPKTEPAPTTYLWFVDLLTPFSHALTMTQELKEHLSHHASAWALNINEGQQTPRQVW